MQRKEKEQGIEQIYTHISVIIGNWKNRLKSHGVPLFAIWPRWDRLAKQESHKKKHKNNVRKNK
jgi:hypothetical protein